MSEFCNNVLIFTVLIIKIQFLSKLAPNFGFYMKFTKKVNCHLFMFYCFFGPILSYVQNCIPLNFMYLKRQPLNYIKKYFYSYRKFYQQLKNTLYILSPFDNLHIIRFLISIPEKMLKNISSLLFCMQDKSRL